ncbi:MAG: hypothetical protein ACHQ0Y_13880 [Thermodesulfovibrionales bacterium]
MKGLLIITLLIMAVFVTMPIVVNAAPPLSQSLVREGTLATRLADVLKLGPVGGEAEAESALSAAGIAPRNGWIADYPVTPDIAGELEASVGDAAGTGILSITKDAALKTFRDVMSEYNLPVAAEGEVRSAEASPPDYPDAEALDNYYDSEGPPVVTYYAPPSDYAYMYDWVASPFWWSGVWFSGFLILTDFDVRVHSHGHKRGDGHDEFISNHFRDGTGRTARIDPTDRTAAAVGMQRAPALSTHTRSTSTSGSTCSSCHYSAPSGGGRSSGFSGWGNRGSHGGSSGRSWNR